MVAAARNYGGAEQVSHADRYSRGEEFVQVVKALWDSWAEGALRIDKEAGVFADPDAVRRPNYRGRWICARGPLSVPRSPQGRPVLMQAYSAFLTTVNLSSFM